MPGPASPSNFSTVAPLADLSHGDRATVTVRIESGRSLDDSTVETYGIVRDTTGQIPLVTTASPTDPLHVGNCYRLAGVELRTDYYGELALYYARGRRIPLEIPPGQRYAPTDEPAPDPVWAHDQNDTVVNGVRVNRDRERLVFNEYLAWHEYIDGYARFGPSAIAPSEALSLETVDLLIERDYLDPDRQRAQTPSVATLISQFTWLGDRAPGRYQGGLQGYMSRPGPKCTGMTLDGFYYRGPTTAEMREYVRTTCSAAAHRTIRDDHLSVRYRSPPFGI